MSGFIAGCGVQPNQSGAQVIQQFAFLNKYTNETFESAVKLAEDIAAIQIPNLAFTIDLDAPANYSIKDSGEGPALDSVTLAKMPALPPTPGYDTILAPTPPGPVPSSPGNSPLPDIAPAPTAYVPSFLPQPGINIPVTPTYGDLTSGVPFPVLNAIVLPTPPNVDVDSIQFLGTPPVFTGQAPDAKDFKYTDPGYTELMVSDLKTTILAMINGQTGLPIDVENAIWNREAEREDAESARAEQEVRDDWAMRGQTLPGGALDSKLMQVRQNSQNKRVSLGRDVMIRIHEALLDQLKTGIAQGVALETLWVNLYSSQQDRQLQAARFAIDIAIAVYNAQIAQYRADADVFRTFADVYKTEIEAELAKLQVYSEELKGLQIIGELNEQEVRIYTARLDAIKTNVSIYLANIQAYSAQIEGQNLILKAYQTSIETEKTKLEASDLDVKIWQGLLQGQSLIQDAWKTRVEIYSEMVRAWTAEYQADIERYKGDIEKMDAVTQRYLGVLKGFDTFANYQRSIADVTIASNTSKVQAFSAQVTADSAYNQALVTKMKAIADSLRDSKDLALKNGEINVQSALETVRLLEAAKQVAVQVLSQLAGGALSAASVHAGISDSTGATYSCSTNLNESFSAN